MRIALATLVGFALLGAMAWAADKPGIGFTTKSYLKVNMMSDKMASMVIQPSVARSAKMKDRAMLEADKIEQAQVVVPQSLKKVRVVPGTVKMNKLEDKSSKMMLKAPVARKMKDEGPQYADRIQGLELGVK